MKVLEGGPHSPGVGTSRSQLQDGHLAGEFLEFSEVYRAFFHEVQRWARALGIPSSELEDLAQEVFVVVRRKLHAFDGQNLAGWLFRITERTASDQRRRAWFRNLFSRRSYARLDTIEWGGAGPAEALERRQLQAELATLLAKMSEKRRTAFVLFEIEGYGGEEIAALLDLPVATVYTRLHHARKDFLALTREHMSKEVR